MLPSGSVELELKVTGAPLSTSLALSPKAGCGGRLRTVIECEAERLAPSSSVTVSVTLGVPLWGQLRTTTGPVASVVPLPSKSHS